MSSDRKLTELKKFGQKIAARLEEAGIHSESQLRTAGVVEAHRSIKANHPDETLQKCDRLYLFEDALCDLHWDKIGES